jgi:protein MpaA
MLDIEKKIRLTALLSVAALLCTSLPADAASKSKTIVQPKASQAAKVSAASEDLEPPSGVDKTIPQLMAALRERHKRFHWDLSYFVDEGWQSKHRSVNGMPLIYWTCGDAASKNRSLVISAIHGDEITPVYFGFRLVEWVKARPEICKDRFVIIAPMINPDGVLRYTNGTRTNWNKVDLNRNFDTPDWNDNALKYWREKFGSQRRYYPGPVASSEAETQFQKWLIEEFKPNKILSIHSPLNIFDYDGPGDADSKRFTKNYIDSCEELKSRITKATPELNFFAYGNFPGSLGNYAGVQRGIPTLTVELPTSKAEEAPYYFSALEKGTKLFFEYDLKENPLKISSQPKP